MAAIDFELVRGDSFAVTLRFKNPDGSERDVSGWSFLGQVRSDPDTTLPLADFTIDDSAASVGEIVCSLDPDDTKTFSGSFVYYDIQLTTDSGFIRTAPRGRLLIVKDVTHA